MIATDVDTKGESHADFNTAPRRDTPVQLRAAGLEAA